jgi:hypothetical protein
VKPAILRAATRCASWSNALSEGVKQKVREHVDCPEQAWLKAPNSAALPPKRQTPPLARYGAAPSGHGPGAQDQRRRTTGCVRSTRAAGSLRERAIVGERTRIINRMKADMARLGVRCFKPDLRSAPKKLGSVRPPPEGVALPPNTSTLLRGATPEPSGYFRYNDAPKNGVRNMNGEGHHRKTP